MRSRLLSAGTAFERVGFPAGGAGAVALFTAMGFTFSAGVDQSQTSNPFVAGRLNSDGSGGPVSGFSLTGTSGLTIPARAPYFATLSPDSNWLVLHWGNNDASPATQMYKRSGPKTWAYHSGLTNMPNSGSFVGIVPNLWFTFNASSTRVTSGNLPTLNTPYTYELVGNTWVDRGNTAGTSYNWCYSESNDGRLRLQLNNGGTTLLYSLDGGAQNSINIGKNSFYGRIWVSPLGTRVAVYGTNLGNDGFSYVTFFSWNGTTLSFLSQYGGILKLGSPSVATWLSEDTISFGTRSSSASSGGTPVDSNYMHIVRNGVGFSTVVVDRTIYNSTINNPDVLFDTVVDTILLSSGVIGYATLQGVLGTILYSGNTITSVGPAVGIRQPRSLLGTNIFRTP